MAWETETDQETGTVYVFDPEFHEGRRFTKLEMEKLSTKIGAQYDRSRVDIDVATRRSELLQTHYEDLTTRKTNFDSALSMFPE